MTLSLSLSHPRGAEGVQAPACQHLHKAAVGPYRMAFLSARDPAGKRERLLAGPFCRAIAAWSCLRCSASLPAPRCRRCAGPCWQALGPGGCGALPQGLPFCRDPVGRPERLLAGLFCRAWRPLGPPRGVGHAFRSRAGRPLARLPLQGVVGALTLLQGSPSAGGRGGFPFCRGLGGQEPAGALPANAPCGKG
jgi:hypothetical protein